MKSKQVVALLAALMLSGFAGEALAAKKKSPSNGAPTAEQRKKLHKLGLQNCRKKYGSRLHEVRIEKFYGRWSTVCYVY
jgi:hypothetical protein